MRNIYSPICDKLRYLEDFQAVTYTVIRLIRDFLENCFLAHKKLIAEVYELNIHCSNLSALLILVSYFGIFIKAAFYSLYFV